MDWSRRKLLKASALGSLYSLTAPRSLGAAQITAVAALDHVQLASADLDSGITWFQERTGVRATFGGVHPGHGTRNALVSLGRRQYLEIYALDPQQANADNEDVRQLRRLTSPGVIGWAIGTNDLDGLRRQADAAGFETAIEVGSRDRPDGKVLRWRVLFVRTVIPLVPFAIEWSADSPHPSADAPPAGTVAQLVFESPDPEQLTKALQAFGVAANIRPSASPRIRLTLTTKKGRVEIS